MPMMAFAEMMNCVKVMIAGLKANAEKLARRGVDQAFVDRMEKIYLEIATIDNEHEAIKAVLKTKTSELNARVDELYGLFQEAKKVIKLELPQEAWIGYGMADKK
jgi:TolA-binding protein